MPTIIEQELSEASRLLRLDDPTRAASVCQQILEKDRDNPGALQLLHIAYYTGNQPEQALTAGERLLKVRPTADAWYMQGLCLANLGRQQESLAAHQEAVKLDPKHTRALGNIAVYFGRAGMFEHSISAFKQAIAQAPTSVSLHNNFANALKDGGFIHQAMDMYRRTLRLCPNYEGVLSNYCYVSQFDPKITLEELQTRHEEWDRRFVQPRKYDWPEHQNERDPDRALRVGFLSEDLRHHTVGHYLIPVLENLPEDLQTHMYSLTNRRDELTERFEACGTFLNVSGADTTTLIDRILEDQIDVLFDLSGHTSGNRLRVLAAKPAPVQMTWLGYVGTTGLSAIDYKIGSHTSIPEGTERFYAEKVLRFPEPYSHQCYEPGCFGDCPVGPPPSIENGYPTFGSFSNIAKLNNDVLSAWARLLNRCPGSRLLLKGGAYHSTYTCDRLSRTFEQLGIDPQRIEFEPFTQPPQAFETYNKIDVVLDPWPFSGCTTTCEALWMGVPIVTWPHETEASRHTLSYLSAVGLYEGVVDDESTYVDTAVRLARDERRRTHLRETLRDRFVASPVCDGPAYGQMVGQLIRDAWRTWCERD